MKLPVMVREVMTPTIVSVDASASVKDAANLMLEKGIGSVIVMEGEKPVGIMTERDILKRVVVKGLDPATTKVKEVMSSPLVTVKADTYIVDASRIMAEKNIRRLLVVEDSKAVGIVTEKDLLRALNSYLALGLKI
ncbi:MAG: signal transduction protein [Thermoprotei archaeon]|nr:MAG: signal transduction protein [Thermoprotei archaeon]